MVLPAVVNREEEVVTVARVGAFMTEVVGKDVLRLLMHRNCHILPTGVGRLFSGQSI